MKHLQAGAFVGAAIILGGVVWNLLGTLGPVIIGLAIAATIVVAIIDWYTEKESSE